MKSVMDEFITYRLHEGDEKRLPSLVKTIMSEYKEIQFYPEGKKKGKKFDKVVEFKKLLKRYKSVIKSNDGIESNQEGICVDMMVQLFSTMMLSDIRKLKLERLLEK